MPTVDFWIFGSVAKGNTTSFYFRPNVNYLHEFNEDLR